ncbi:hypothetical protein [Streptomyces sp. XY431]|uniref:hypothetical protein n=1 Tax=Streptomyces sp. XY431 TaxID=1415562 RepID=UPI0013314A58|nr:hypothetical protein [Streptomyces sp. XY431]
METEAAMRRRKRTLEDWEVGAQLRWYALLEIRAMSGRRKPIQNWPDDDYVACIRWLADLCDNIPFLPEPCKPWWSRARSERRFAYAWAIADERGRQWILSTVDKFGWNWTPPSTSSPVPLPQDEDCPPPDKP